LRNRIHAIDQQLQKEKAAGEEPTARNLSQTTRKTVRRQALYSYFINKKLNH
jgi:hypothetical protein